MIEGHAHSGVHTAAPAILLKVEGGGRAGAGVTNDAQQCRWQLAAADWLAALIFDSLDKVCVTRERVASLATRGC